MSTSEGPIIIIEDDLDDQDMMREVLDFLKVTNELKFFQKCQDALNYLYTTADRPFLIFSDINLPGMTGTELRHKINEDPFLRMKSIPFLFLTTSSAKENVVDAYKMMVQGYFVKPLTIGELRSTMNMIIGYWNTCLHPNSM